MTKDRIRNTKIGKMPKNKAKCRIFEYEQFEKSAEIWYNNIKEKLVTGGDER